MKPATCEEQIIAGRFACRSRDIARTRQARKGTEHTRKREDQPVRWIWKERPSSP